MNILIVDDEKIERDGIKGLINHFGYKLEVDTAFNGEDALKKFEKKSYDIVLTDIKMPMMDGITFLQRLKNAGIEPICIIYSAYGEFEYARNAISLGVLEYLLKPIELEKFKELFDRVISICEEREMIKKLGIIEKHQIKDIERITSGKSKETHLTKLAREMVYSRYGDSNLSVSMLADELNVSVTHISSTFKEDTGQNLSKFITTVRLNKAKELLVSTNQKINSISETVGYSNTSYFISLFRANVGISPAQYRREKDDEYFSNEN